MICEICQETINPERLEALPDTVLCVDCSRNVGGEYDLRVLEENVGNSVLTSLSVHRTKRSWHD